MKHRRDRTWLGLATVVTLMGAVVIFGLRAARAQSAPPTVSTSWVQPNGESGAGLANPGFEGDWAHTPCDIYNAYGLYIYSAPIGEIAVPEGWTAFFRHGPPVTHDPGNSVGWAQPEVQVINKAPPYLDPPRIHAGQRALKMFNLWKILDAGLYQQVQVPPGVRWRLSGWAHAWSSQEDDPYRSTGDPLQAWQMVGLDPTGGRNPFGPAVVWSAPAHIYDVYGETPPVEVTSQGGTLTVFVRTWMLWPYKHNDVYWDGITLQPVYTGALPVLRAEPAGRTAYQGQAVTYSVALSTTPGLTAPFTLTLGAIPGAVGAFDPPAIRPGEAATLVVTPSLSTPAGAHQATISGAGIVAAGSVQIPISVTAQIALTVSPADFALEVTPEGVAVLRNRTALFRIGLASTTPGFGFPVALEAGGGPGDALAEIRPAAVTAGERARLMITTTQTTAVSSYGLIITGTAGGLERWAAAMLEVWSGAFLPMVVKR